MTNRFGIKVGVTLVLLAAPAHSFARGVHFGFAPRLGQTHSDFLRHGFLDRRVPFRGSVPAPRTEVAPYPVYSLHVPSYSDAVFPFSVAPP
jgi:hypothetical protein